MSKGRFTHGNPNIWAEMKKRKIRYVSDMCKELKIKRVGDICDLITMKKPAYKKTGGWTGAAKALAKFFGRLPEELFKTEAQIWGLKREVPYRYVVSERDQSSAISTEENPSRVLEKIQTCKEMTLALNSIDKDYAKVLRLRHGIGSNKPLSLRAVGEKLKVSHEQVRQMERFGLVELKNVLLKRA